MCGTTARVTLNTPPTLVSSTALTSSSSNAASWLSRMMPALFTSTSIRSQRSATRSTAALHAAHVGHVDLFRGDVAARAAATTSSAASLLPR